VRLNVSRMREMIFFAVWCALLLGVLALWDRRSVDPAHPGVERMRADLEKAKAKPKAESKAKVEAKPKVESKPKPKAEPAKAD
jgi:hypothetical protein